MAEKIVVPLNKNQQATIKKLLGGACDTLEFDREELTNVLKYMPAPVMIDLDEKQQQVLRKYGQSRQCNFAILDGSDLCRVLRYMPPPVVKYMPPPGGVVKYMPPPVVVRYMPPPAKRKAKK